jgi:tetratricopeptide (TPR) repeat protein
MNLSNTFLQESFESTASSFETREYMLSLKNLESEMELAEQMDPEKLLVNLAKSDELIASFQKSHYHYFVDTMVVKAKILIKLNLFYEALILLEKAASYCREKYELKIPKIYLLQSIIYQKRKTNPRRSRMITGEAIELCLKLLNKLETDQDKVASYLVVAYLNMAILELSRGNHDKAIDHICEGLDLKNLYSIDEDMYIKYFILTRNMNTRCYIRVKDIFDVEPNINEIYHRQSLGLIKTFASGLGDKFAKQPDDPIKRKNLPPIDKYKKSRKARETQKTKKKILEFKKKNLTNFEKNLQSDSKSAIIIKYIYNLKSMVKKKLERKKIRAEFLENYLAYGKQYINGFLYFVSFKFSLKTSEVHSSFSSQFMNNLVVLSAYSLEKKCPIIRDSCYILSEIIERLGIHSKKNLYSYNQITLLDCVECNEYGRIVLKTQKILIDSKKRLIYKTNKIFSGMLYSIKLFSSTRNYQNEIEVVVENRAEKYSTYVIYEYHNKLKELTDSIVLNNSSLIIKK